MCPGLGGVSLEEPPRSASRSPDENSEGQAEMLLKIIGAIIVIWVAFAVIGFVVKAVGFLLIAAAVVTVGVIGYNAVKGSSERKQIR
jgi:uncharacterized membrane protein